MGRTSYMIFPSHGSMSRKLTGETNSISTTLHLHTCSSKLTGEANPTTPHVDVLWLTGEVMKHTLLDTTPQKMIGVVMTHVNESLPSEVDWGAHDSSVFLILVNIDYDAKPNESPIQILWGELQHRTSSIPLIGLQTDSLATGQKLLQILSFQIQLQWTVVSNKHKTLWGEIHW